MYYTSHRYITMEYVGDESGAALASGTESSGEISNGGSTVMSASKSEATVSGVAGSYIVDDSVCYYASW